MSTHKQTKSTQVLEKMRSDILQGLFRPKEKLSMALLKEKYQVGYSPLREALANLAAIGLVIFKDQCGFYVAPLSLDEMQDLYQTRILIETQALSLAIEHGDDTWEANILACWHRYTKFLRQVELKPLALTSWDTFEKEFSNTLLSACQSTWLLRLQNILYDNTARYRYLCMNNNLNDQTVIFNYIQQNDELVKATLNRNLIQAITLFRDSFQSSLEIMTEKLTTMWVIA
ncbi:GntR family transcriptional regulator [Legionella sp. D16C41]|uniref:GntR family transcriptional regulator n=1 Tax=Legionella sp. D16C41 TaxID=3402688 RepID=UPI003AF989AA